ncbi:SusD/RagB family nutrient-binding outer membrane lipoprotein [Parapedobacter tibetensis]|uniref:SusD/RagB family nutrient-binding outer membrane lipoprotein n=1 Tax=Parapedobacter tibetensis TaxID=2972951 RepID=UPI00214D18D9|nr:SusD/RagB family nutrient-binding outer membrane lipoprotein [Parapedobacter tibetensis]
MKKNTIKTGLLVLMVMVAVSCSNYLDINDDPNNPTKVSAANRIAGAISTSNGAAQWRGTREIAGVTQYGLTAITASGTNRNAETWRFTASYFLWQNAYVNTMPNCADLIVLGEDEGNIHFVGVGKTLLALNFGLLTDQYGPIVVDDYYDGRSQLVLTPSFQDQQTVYQRIQALLDEALEAFNSTQNTVGLNAKGGDILYAGDIDKWKRFAWALKARYMNHLSKKSSLYDPQATIAACANAFNADGMDAEFAYLGDGMMEDENPWSSWGGFAEGANHRYFTWSQFFVNMLSSFPVTNNSYVDPRIVIIMTPAEDGEFRGFKPGGGLAGGQGLLANGTPGDASKTDSADYGRFSQSGFYTNTESPFPFITYSEVKFIEAEARLRNGDAAGALAAYEEGVKAHMRKLGVPVAAINSYWQAQLADGVVSNFNTLMSGLSHIMRQKYIALCLNPETWVDMRRMDYSKEIYGPSLTRPINLNDVVFDVGNENQWIQAMCYETNEQNRNPDAVGDNSERTRLLTPLWWNVED